ncbi:hypothetical protein SAMN04487898_109201 [Pedobacter sp. ok626]|uniref:hypothetical protein n=1 Tax=Pedobacter sp. ok626 TaxID=1761882 RepID=UPI00087E4ACA|nr:hypothetical protein [Pedobacter sp. ok626]SDK58654.1 hypothetical protein SAMN04487898_109201 [Pedobacter sp. ok626]
MNEDILNTLSKIILDSAENPIAKPKDREVKKKTNSDDNELSKHNHHLYNDLYSKFKSLSETNSPISEKITALNKLIDHNTQLLEIKSYSVLPADAEFHRAIFELNNRIKEYRLFLERDSLISCAEPEHKAPIGRTTEVLKYNETELSQNQLLFLFNEMRNERIITSDLTNVEIARAVEILTGLSSKKFGQELSNINTREFSKTEKEQLKTKLLNLDKAVDKLKDKKTKK